MRLDGILGPDLEQQGFSIEETMDLIQLWYKGKLVATWYPSTATHGLMKRVARAWLKEHGEQAG